MPPLEWLDCRDSAQLDLAYEVLKSSPFLMEFYLHELFPRLLRHCDSKLSANGQDLGGDILCSSRLGFSGTPNDLLPKALGACRYASGDDAKMLTALSDLEVVDVAMVEDGWTVAWTCQATANVFKIIHISSNYSFYSFKFRYIL